MDLLASFIGSMAFVLFWQNETKEATYQVYSKYAACAAVLLFIARIAYGKDIWLSGVIAIGSFIITFFSCYYFQQYRRKTE